MAVSGGIEGVKAGAASLPPEDRAQSELDELRRRNQELERALGATQEMVRTLVGAMDASREGLAVSIPLVEHDSRAARPASERLLRAMFDGALDAILLSDESGRYVDANPAACALFGLTREELIGRRISEFAAPGYERPNAWYALIEQGLLHGEFVLRRSDGTSRALDYSPIANILPGLHLSVLRDITERKHTEEALRASEARYRRIVENTSEGVWMYDESGVTTFMNGRMAEMLGYTVAEAVGRPIFDFMDDESRPEARARMERRRRGTAERSDFRLRRRDGAEVWVAIQEDALFDSAGRFESALALVVDITDRRRATEVRNHLAAIVESSEDAIISKGLDGKITSWNGGAERLFGYTAEEAIGKPISILIPPSRAEEESQILIRVEHGEKIGGVDTVRRRKNGSLVDVSLLLSPIRDSTGQVIGASKIARDLTERRHAERALRRSEEQLRQALKMEAIGSLAGGVAHDFNNLLSVILSYTDLVIDDLSPDTPVVADLEQVHKAAIRAGELTSQLLTFSRQQMLQPTILDLNQIVTGIEKMLKRVLGEDIQLSLVLAPEIGKVHADSGRLEQVIMNLVVNARDALPRGGNLTIETADVHLDEAQAARHHGVAPGPYIMLAVTDTGTGMDRATMDRIFDPFFTTKEKGKGTGLGLSTVFGIVQQSGGHITVASRLGEGTTFKVYLPRTARAANALVSLPPAPVIRSGFETILLVEDEEQVRAVMRSILRKHGYDVLEAQNAGEAFLISERHAACVHLLLTDVVMPRMSGRELAARLAPLRPQMKVLYVSGYVERSVAQHGVLEEGISFLQKPITPESLLRKVREVLDAPRRLVPSSGSGPSPQG